MKSRVRKDLKRICSSSFPCFQTTLLYKTTPIKTTNHFSSISQPENELPTQPHYQHNVIKIQPEEIAYHKQFFDNLATKLELKSISELSTVTHNKIIQYGGKRILRKYNNNLTDCLRHIYPSHFSSLLSIKKKPNGFWFSISNQRSFFDSLFIELKLKSMEDWYLVDNTTIKKNGGKEILIHYKFNLLFALHQVYSPNFTFFYQMREKSFDWNSLHFQTLFLTFLSNKLNYQSLDHWISSLRSSLLLSPPSPSSSINSFHDSIVDNPPLDVHNNVLYNSNDLQDNNNNPLYKNKTDNSNNNDNNDNKYESKSVKYQSTNEELFSVMNENRKRIKETENELRKVINKYGGRKLLSHYSNNIYQMINEISNNHSFTIQKKKAIWDDVDYQLAFLEKIFKEWKFESLDDWNNVTNRQLMSVKGGKSILARYNDSVSLMLISLYPNHNWNLLERSKLPQRYWTVQNQLKFFNSLYIKWKFNSLDDWYKVNMQKVVGEGGGGLLRLYNNNLFRALSTIYPQHHWQVIKSKSKFRFREVNFHSFISHLQNKFKVKRKEDWYRISIHQIEQEFFGGNYRHSLGTLYQILMKFHPKEKWDKRAFSVRSKKATQRLLYISLNSLFPSLLLYEEYIHPLLHYSASNMFPIFDIFIPSLNFAFEYDGEQHFDDLPQGFSPVEIYKDKEMEKGELSKSLSILIIQIPYWWDRTEQSLLDSLLSLPSFTALPSSQ